MAITALVAYVVLAAVIGWLENGRADANDLTRHS